MAGVHVDLVATEVQRLVGAREVKLDVGMTLATLLQARHQPQQAETGRRVQSQAVKIDIADGPFGAHGEAVQDAGHLLEVLLTPDPGGIHDSVEQSNRLQQLSSSTGLFPYQHPVYEIDGSGECFTTLRKYWRIRLPDMKHTWPYLQSGVHTR